MGASAERALASEVCLRVPPPSWANYVFGSTNQIWSLPTGYGSARGRDSRKLPTRGQLSARHKQAPRTQSSWRRPRGSA